MAIGVVIDTNILIHAENETIYCYQECVNVITHLIESTEDILNVDIDFDFITEAENNSSIGQEYWKHIHTGMLGHTMILQVIFDGRIDFVPPKPHYHIVKKIDSYGIKKSDRHFLGITYSTANKILITEDFEDFTVKNRTKIKKDLGINVIQAYQIFQPE